MVDAWSVLVKKARLTQSSAVVVLRPGGEVREWWDDAGPRTAECMSVTKFVVAMALGLAVGVDELESPLRTWIDDWADDERGDISLARVLSHTSGLEVRPAASVYQAASVRSLVLDSPLTGPPGGFAYNNVAIHLAGLVAERASGLPLHELAGDRLFAPLGIQEWDWQLDPEGFPLCMAGLWLRATDLALVASLHLTSGRAFGRQVLAPEWLAALPPSAPGEVGLGCFAQFSAAEAGRRIGFGHDGDLGQWVTVQPAMGVVGVRVRTSIEEGEDSLWRDFPTDVGGMA